MLFSLRNLLWSGVGTLLLLGFGLYFSIKTRFVQLDLRGNMRAVKASVGGGSAFGAVATALGGTVGAGSITGVAAGIAIGGAGSIFWMWVSGFFGMALRYAETFAAASDRERGRGGAPLSLLKLGRKKAAYIFVGAAVFVSFGTGGMAQSSAVSEALLPLGIPGFAAGAAVAAIFAAVTLFGKRAIIRANTFLMPVACLVYVSCLIYILVCSRSGIGNAFVRIFASAFGFESALGGFAAYGIIRALREGVSRGVFSNESGMGSAPLAYCTAEGQSPDTLARLGIFEIFADTFGISTLTALCLLSGGFDSVFNMFAAVFGRNGLWLLAAMLLIFALAAMLCWNLYARTALSFTPLGAKLSPLFTAASVLFVFAGAVIPPQSALDAADIFNIVMILPNLYLLSLKSGRISAGFRR